MRCILLQRSDLINNYFIINTNQGFPTAGKVSPNRTQQTELGDCGYVQLLLSFLIGLEASSRASQRPSSMIRRREHPLTFNSSSGSQRAARAKRHTETAEEEQEE